jgi:hypothetical protein
VLFLFKLFRLNLWNLVHNHPMSGAVRAIPFPIKAFIVIETVQMPRNVTTIRAL